MAERGVPAGAAAQSGAGSPDLAFVCPHCRGVLSRLGDARRCEGCARDFGSQAGVADLRVFPDPYLGYDQDRERGEQVLLQLERLALPELLRHYWSLSAETPPALRERFTQSALLAEEKGRRLLELLPRSSPRAWPRRVLEIGSGTGGFLAVAAGRFEQVFGLDIAMRWLQLSRRRLAGHAVTLVCACAEHLPFPDRSFDLVVIAATLEFTRDPGRVLAEAARTLAEGGLVLLQTTNRFSLAPEPLLGLWGLGFLPRRWQEAYAHLRRGVSQLHVRPLSYLELRRHAAAHFGSQAFAPADVPDALLAALPAAQAAQVRLYRRLARLAPFAALLRWLGPEWDVVLHK